MLNYFDPVTSSRLEFIGVMLCVLPLVSPWLAPLYWHEEVITEDPAEAAPLKMSLTGPGYSQLGPPWHISLPHLTTGGQPHCSYRYSMGCHETNPANQTPAWTTRQIEPKMLRTAADLGVTWCSIYPNQCITLYCERISFLIILMVETPLIIISIKVFYSPLNPFCCCNTLDMEERRRNHSNWQSGMKSSRLDM